MVETVNYIYFFNTKDLIQASKNEKIKLIKKSLKFIKNISKGKNLEGAPLDRIFKRLFLEEIEKHVRWENRNLHTEKNQIDCIPRPRDGSYWRSGKG